MRIAWVRAFGSAPEQEAWSRLRAWAEPQGLLEHPERHLVFGFNKPAPERGAPEYGYEMWISIGRDTTPGKGIGVREFAGGLYAVTPCRLVGGVGVPTTWKALLRWVHTSEHTWRRSTHELERLCNPLAAVEDGAADRRMKQTKPTRSHSLRRATVAAYPQRSTDS